MLITNEQRNIANQLNQMETFSKLRPPDAVRIKAKFIETLNENECVSQEFTSCDESPTNKANKNYKIKQIKKFCVDPLITSYDILFNLISQAFGIKEEFQLSYLNREPSQSDSLPNSVSSSTTTINENQSEYLALYNDWDLDAAFLNASQPYLSINIQLIHKETQQNAYDEWEVIHATESAFNKNNLKHIRLNESAKKELKHSSSTNNLNRSFISNAADKAVSVFQRVFNFNRSTSFQGQVLTRSNSESNDTPVLFDLSIVEQLVKSKPALADAEFKNFLDSDGRVVQTQELKQRIFEGGCDPSKRKELWPILLDIFPHQSMTLHERNEFIKIKSIEYQNLKSNLWYNSNKCLHQNSSQIVSDSSFDSNTNFSDEQQLNCLAHKIYKDVWRTDRNHKFYGGDSNKNIEFLFNILMTYTLAHPDQPYSQGMSDLLSPILFVLKDEPLSYICFCALMKRCAYNFDIQSDSITSKIKLLAALIQKFDPELWTHLSQVGAEQLLFVYRWLLIECKREFPFNDSLRMFEIMWSTTQNNTRTRSNSNTSSASLKLYKNLKSKKLNEYLNEEDFIEDEVSNENLDMSDEQHLRTNNNNDCSNCDLCVKDDEMTEIETDTDLESVNGFNYYNRFRKSKQRTRRLSLNSSFFSHKTKTRKAAEPSSLNNNCFLFELKEQQMEEKRGKKTPNRRLLNYLRKKKFSSSHTGSNSLTRSKSLGCLSSSKVEGLRRTKSELNLKINYDSSAKKVPILFAKKLRGSLMGQSSSSRFSTSEAETLRNSVSKHRPSSTSSDLSDDLNKLIINRKKAGKCKKKVKIANSSPKEIAVNNDGESNTRKKQLFKNIKKSLEKSHLRISKKFNKMKTCSHKNSTSSKSSTSAYVSAGSVISSASSSTCSTPLLDKKPKTTTIPIIRVQHGTPVLENKDVALLDEEQLVFELSKLDNPFLLFICFAIFLENREHIMSTQMDSNDIACYFDKMTRKHNMKNILIRARYLYTKLYLAKVNVFNYIQQLMDIQNSP